MKNFLKLLGAGLIDSIIPFVGLFLRARGEQSVPHQIPFFNRTPTLKIA